MKAWVGTSGIRDPSVVPRCGARLDAYPPRATQAGQAHTVIRTIERMSSSASVFSATYVVDAI